jgi:3-hydroxybutyryl-CoA dehydrogenase
VRCDGRPATALAKERPVIVVDRTLDDATAAGIAIAASDGCPAAAVEEATRLLQAAGLIVYMIDDAPGLVVTRTVAMLVNGAVDARHKGVASAADIDTAMRLGNNYPLGPLALTTSPAALITDAPGPREQAGKPGRAPRPVRTNWGQGRRRVGLRGW